MRVPVEPALLNWACERVGWDPADAEARFPSFPKWVADGDERKPPTMKQLERFARATHTPLGYLFLPEPPVEELPIPDLRTIRDVGVDRPSPDLLETVYTCQSRQAWYQDHLQLEGEASLPFVGSATVASEVVETAARMRATLGYALDDQQRARSWTDALRRLIQRAEDAGILVMVNGVVGSNTHRPLDPEEFRGFALVDPLAPLVFVNGADTKAAQMFTLAHELAHVWLGASALSDVSARVTPGPDVERWCNAVAAELLVSMAVLRGAVSDHFDWNDDEAVLQLADGLRRRFKVSSLVALRRLHEGGFLDQASLWRIYRREHRRLVALAEKNRGGGDYYLSKPAKVSRRFAEAVYVSAWEGRASFTEAMRLLGVKKMATFEKLGSSLGIDAQVSPKAS